MVENLERGPRKHFSANNDDDCVYADRLKGDICNCNFMKRFVERRCDPVAEDNFLFGCRYDISDEVANLEAVVDTLARFSSPLIAVTSRGRVVPPGGIQSMSVIQMTDGQPDGDTSVRSQM